MEAPCAGCCNALINRAHATPATRNLWTRTELEAIVDSIQTKYIAPNSVNVEGAIDPGHTSHD